MLTDMRSSLVAFALVLGHATVAWAQVSPPAEVRDAVATGDLARAESLLRSASTAGDPMTPCWLGEVQRARGALEASVASFELCAEGAARLGTQGAPIEARALVGRAMGLELDPERLEEARSAWSAVARFAESHSALIDVAIPRARLRALDAASVARATAEPVRQLRNNPTP